MSRGPGGPLDGECAQASVGSSWAIGGVSRSPPAQARVAMTPWCQSAPRPWLVWPAASFRSGMRAGLRGILVGHRRRVTIAAGPGQGRDDALVPVGAKAVAGLAGRQLRPGPGNHALALQAGADDQAAAADEGAGLGLAAVGRRLVIGPGQPLQDLQ